MIEHRPLLITSGLRTSAIRTPQKIAMASPGSGQRTYREFVGRMDKTIQVAKEIWQIKSGDIVAIIAPNCLEYFEIIGAISELGAASATVNYRLTASEVLQIVEDSTAKVIIYHPSCSALVEGLDALETVTNVVQLGTDFEALLESVSADRDFKSAAKETDVFTIPYTSGTTGLPKGVMFAHRNRVLTFYSMAAEYQCYSSASHFLAIAPQCHGAGFSFAFAPLFFGGSVELLASFDAQTVIERLAQGDIDGIFMVPTHFQAIFALPQEILEANRGKHRLKTIISNAAPLSQAMKVKIVAYFGEGILHETYGSTEGGIVTNLRPEFQLEKKKCVGPPFVDTEISIRDSNGNEVPANEPGELFSRGPATFSGYWNRTDATTDGWISVGDIAVRDDDGFIYIVDRMKDMILSGGINVYPREVEDEIAKHDGIEEVAVYGVPSEKWGESIRAAIVLKSGMCLDEDELTRWLSPRIAKYKLPRAYEVIDAMPRNASGKILKRVLIENFKVDVGQSRP